MEINLLDDVASSSNELGAVSELAERQLQLEDDIVALEDQLKQAKEKSPSIIAPKLLCLNSA